SSPDPEAYMSTMDLIRYWGYPVESHDVQTADGYILSLFRIPFGRFSDRNSSCHRPAVLFVHGLGAGASEFLMNPPESCPAFLLADAGFDVFLMNHRGTTYSKRHITLKPWDNKFWQYTIDELVKYDMPPVIDKAIELSGQSSLYWIGHSQGTAVGFMTPADHPQYNQKIKALFQLAPAASGGYAQGLIKIGFWAYANLKPVVDFYRIAFGSHEIAFQWSFIYRPLVRLCNIIPFATPICDSATHLLFGPSTRTLNITRAPVYLSHTPSGMSTWIALHWAQMSSHKRVEHMDHNPLENIQRYGQEKPPPYDYSKIDVPIYYFWSKSDWLGTPEDIERILLKTLRPDVVKGAIEVDGYNHIDYVVSTDCAEKVFKPITDIVRKQESNMCEK
ncbi:hypothetical protein PENTCL1PPCAC_3277, partial [Pristionchus entomophagus]